MSDGPVSHVKPRSRICARAPAGRSALLDDDDLVARALQPQGGGEPAEARADDDGPHGAACRCPGPSAAAAGAPVAHVASRSCSITVPIASSRAVGPGGDEERPRQARRRRAEREALRDLDAVAQPARGDDRQPPGGRARLHDRDRGRQPPVGERGRDGACARVAAPLDERPVRAARAGHVDGRDAGVAQQRHVLAVEAEADLLDHHGSRREPLHHRRDAVEHAREARLALGLHRLLERVEVDAQPVGVEQLDEPLGPRRAVRAAHLRGAEVGEQQRRAMRARGR